MKVVSLLYHDAIEDPALEESGFLGRGADVYKVDAREMKRHFEAIGRARDSAPSSIHDLLDRSKPRQVPFLLTFDDGGVSAATSIAPMLAELGWIGHFFVTAGCIDTERFLTSVQVRELASQGHVIGSHSWSHPARMSKCGWDELRREWRDSVARLSDIVGEPVRVASVPGGYFSTKVARAASDCGIRALFTSEPVKRVRRLDDCAVIGRYTVMRGRSSEYARSLASTGLTFHQAMQYALWNSKKLAKSLGGRHYLTLRERILRRHRSA